MRLLIVEDDAEFARALRDALERRGYASDWAGRVADAERWLSEQAYGAALVDLGLPDGDGVALARRLRDGGATLPLIALTARSGLTDRIDGLNAGFDDYLVKPFDVDELVARLNAVLRRQGGRVEPTVQAGNVAFDTATRELTVDGQTVPLSPRERELAELLLARVGRVISKRAAEEQLYGADAEVGSNVIEVHAHRLRKKLEAAGATATVETIRGLGYLLRAPR